MSSDRGWSAEWSARAHMRSAVIVTIALASSSCLAPAAPVDSDRGEIRVGISLLTASERRVRAGQIRDAALARGVTQGYLLAGIADAETSMSHCWSELTWACQGPASADCGGGPVVAGAGDGPCADRQGGLGMFQFDAGTYDDTLAREGDRILSIAGNTSAAVDFVVSMLIRSVYVDGVDDATQAIAWANGVRPDNERWDPWISTVTHYYNGCTPSASCWSSRYAHYLENTRSVYDEMGAEFWNAKRDFAAEYVSQTFPLAAEPFELPPGAEVAGYLELRNAGSAMWTPAATFLGTTQPRDGESPLAGPDWVNPHRAASVDHMVAPGESGRFAFTLRAPAQPGEYPQFFNVVQEGVAWFGDQGGPPDDQLQVRVTVVPAAPCPTGASCPADDPVTTPGGVSRADAGTATPPSGGGMAGSAAYPVPDNVATIDCEHGGDGRCLPRAGEHDGGTEMRARDNSDGCNARPGSRPSSSFALLLMGSALVLVRRRLNLPWAALRRLAA
jgi:hypothetical protein